jgi:hypothetical protein
MNPTEGAFAMYGDLERLARFVAPEVDRLVAEEDAKRVALAAGLTLSNR